MIALLNRPVGANFSPTQFPGPWMGPNGNLIPFGTGPDSANVIGMVMGEDDGRQSLALGLIFIQDLKQSLLLRVVDRTGINQVTRPTPNQVCIGMGAGRERLG